MKEVNYTVAIEVEKNEGMTLEEILRKCLLIWEYHRIKCFC